MADKKVDLVKFEQESEFQFLRIEKDAIRYDVKCAAMLDARRGLWYVENGDQIAIFAGREGDDASFAIGAGEMFTREHFFRLLDCLQTLKYASDIGGKP